jgi:hypothetical protein
LRISCLIILIFNTFRIQQVQQAQQQAITYRTISVVGKLTFYRPVADAIAKMCCSDKKTGKFTVLNTFTTCSSIFQLAGLQKIPIPKDVVWGLSYVTVYLCASMMTSL